MQSNMQEPLMPHSEGHHADNVALEGCYGDDDEVIYVNDCREVGY